MTLIRRRITVIFQLGEGAFGDDGFNTVEVTGLRTSAEISYPGGPSMATLNLRVFGLTLDVMNKLTILGKPLTAVRKNRVTVLAGDDEKGMSVVFSGIMQEAWADMRNAPDTSFVVAAYTGLEAALEPIPPTSFNGSVDAALVVAGLAQQARYAFINSGVNVQISNPYLSGTMLTQLQKIARDGNFNAIISGTGPIGETQNTIVIWPLDGSRGGETVLISPETGMVGYPMRTEAGVLITTLFNPSIVFGGLVEVQSSMQPANAVWRTFSVIHDLESETVNGKWFTRLESSLFNQVLALGKR